VTQFRLSGSIQLFVSPLPWMFNHHLRHAYRAIRALHQIPSLYAGARHISVCHNAHTHVPAYAIHPYSPSIFRTPESLSFSLSLCVCVCVCVRMARAINESEPLICTGNGDPFFKAERDPRIIARRGSSWNSEREILILAILILMLIFQRNLRSILLP